MKKWNTEFYDNEIDNITKGTKFNIQYLSYIQFVFYKTSCIKNCIKTSNGSVQNMKIKCLEFLIIASSVWCISTRFKVFEFFICSTLSLGIHVFRISFHYSSHKNK